MTSTRFTIMDASESGAFSWFRHERQRAKWARLLARGRRISAELEVWAAASTARLEAIDAEFPE